MAAHPHPSAYIHLKLSKTRIHAYVQESAKLFTKIMNRLATSLKKQGYRSTYRFIKNSANHMVTYAKLALKAQRIPCDINLMERLMGEVAKRCKNRWSHWSPTGLENIVDILLVRYMNPNLYASILRNPYTITAATTTQRQPTIEKGKES